MQEQAKVGGGLVRDGVRPQLGGSTIISKVSPIVKYLTIP